MSENCTICVKNKRTGPDLLCDECRAASSLAASTGSAWYPLFEHMSKEHNLTLTDDECYNIAVKSDESRMKAGRSDAVTWILVNALYHLTPEQMHRLGEELAKRSGGTYTPNS